MPWERRKHNRLRHFVRHNRNLVAGGFILLFVLAVVFGLFYFITSSRFVR